MNDVAGIGSIGLYTNLDRIASGLGVRFLAMAKSQARIVRDFCVEARRKNLGAILARIRA